MSGCAGLRLQSGDNLSGFHRLNCIIQHRCIDSTEYVIEQCIDQSKVSALMCWTTVPDAKQAGNWITGVISTYFCGDHRLWIIADVLYSS